MVSWFLFFALVIMIVKYLSLLASLPQFAYYVIGEFLDDVMGDKDELTLTKEDEPKPYNKDVEFMMQSIAGRALKQTDVTVKNLWK